MAFFHFYPVALWHSLNGPFVSKLRKQRRGSRPRSRLIVMGESRAGTSLSEGSCCRNLFSHMSLPAASRMCLCVCTYTACPERRGGPPTPPWSCTTTRWPSQQSPVLHLPPSQCPQEPSEHPNPLLDYEGPGRWWKGAVSQKRCLSNPWQRSPGAYMSCGMCINKSICLKHFMLTPLSPSICYWWGPGKAKRPKITAL